MDLLTDSQLRIINEFRERVRQSEKRLRETLDSRGMRDGTPTPQQDLSYNTFDSTKQSDYKSDKYDTISNSRQPYQKPSLSPLEDSLPQRLLKPVVFNAGTPSGLESIMRLSESLKSDHRSQSRLGNENKPPARKEYEAFASNPPSAKFDSRFQSRPGERESQREEHRDLPQRVEDSILKRSNKKVDQSYNRSPNQSYEVSPHNYSRVDSYGKRPEELRSPITNFSSNNDRTEQNYLYFIDTGKQSRLAVPSIRLFEYDRKDEAPVRDRKSSLAEEDYNVRASYKSQKKSPERISPLRREPAYESFDLGAKRLSTGSGITSPHNYSAEGLDTFGDRSVPKGNRRKSSEQPRTGSHGNILAYEEYRMNETLQHNDRPERLDKQERLGRRTFSHPDKKKLTSTPPKSIKKTSQKNLRVGRSKEREESAKKPQGTDKKNKDFGENEPRKLCKELLRRLKLGTLDVNRFVDIMEDHMFFSTRFYENLKSVVKKQTN